MRTTLSMCKNNLCGVHDLRPLLERMVGTSEDHDLREARMMLGLASLIGLDFRFCVPCLLPSRRASSLTEEWYDNVPLHASFDQARVADDRG